MMAERADDGVDAETRNGPLMDDFHAFDRVVPGEPAHGLRRHQLSGRGTWQRDRLQPEGGAGERGGEAGGD